MFFEIIIIIAIVAYILYTPKQIEHKLQKQLNDIGTKLQNHLDKQLDDKTTELKKYIDTQLEQEEEKVDEVEEVEEVDKIVLFTCIVPDKEIIYKLADFIMGKIGPDNFYHYTMKNDYQITMMYNSGNSFSNDVIKKYSEISVDTIFYFNISGYIYYRPSSLALIVSDIRDNINYYDDKEFYFITIIHPENTGPFFSNKLPTLVDRGVATKVLFEYPMPMSGKYSIKFKD